WPLEEKESSWASRELSGTNKGSRKKERPPPHFNASHSLSVSNLPSAVRSFCLVPARPARLPSNWTPAPNRVFCERLEKLTPTYGRRRSVSARAPKERLSTSRPSHFMPPETSTKIGAKERRPRSRPAK